MFATEREELLESCFWIPRDRKLGYVDTWSCDGADTSVDSTNYRQGYLQDGEVDDWLHQKGRFVAPTRTHREAQAARSIRLLMCERVGWKPVAFAMSEPSFLLIETEFGLPPETLPIICDIKGRESCRLKFDSNNKNLESIAITIKLPQMFQLGNLGLALTHNLQTGTTSALIHGENIFSGRIVTNEPSTPHAERLQDMIRYSASLWTHPLLIPAIILKEHLYRAECLRQKLYPQLTMIERDLGVTRSAGLVTLEEDFNPEIRHLVRNDDTRLRITTLLNTTAADTVIMVRVLKWDHRYLKFLRRVSVDISQFSSTKIPLGVEKEVQGLLNFLEADIVSTGDFGEMMKTRLDMQLNVLYNFVAQSGNDLNSKIAATAGLDSAAMKTLAFLTAVFLPPTFVATLFSMSMFNWQATSDSSMEGDARVVTPSFWIYWVVSIPLTLVTMLVWRVWWHRQKSFYAGEYLTPKPQHISVPTNTELYSVRRWGTG
ncbi:hypothetical protein B0T17DRAFT_99160 [Bombardia bombarda]|uniref:Uncharacterized protein n=1 Tax=Bombardia bombarda TaxID=252184 RepID=A0AA39XP02_9PEZI|nr:hypothetical protein B0T17DRAFT_99160 [Bombardia bombarda]